MTAGKVPTIRWWMVGVVIALIAVPLAGAAADVFTDVSSTNVFHDDITWLANSGVTKGCNPPSNTKFCPSDNVTREQMAAFMHRLAVNRVVDADKVDGYDAAQLGNTITGSVQAGDPITIPIVTDTKLAEVSLAAADGDVALVMTSVEGYTTSGGLLYTTWVQANNGDCSTESDEVPGSRATSPGNGSAGDVLYLAARSTFTMQVSTNTTLTLCGWVNIANSIDVDPVTISVVQSHNGSVTVNGG